MKYTRNQTIHSFHPLTAKNPEILILGSIPGKESLRKQEYYGHPRNTFWKILSSITGITYTDTYRSKINLIQNANLALWDVCEQAHRKTSLDTDIKNEKPNPLNEFITSYPSIKAVIFNGRKASQLYDKYFLKRQGITYTTLLSTSPANAVYTFEQKLGNWQTAFNKAGLIYR